MTYLKQEEINKDKEILLKAAYDVLRDAQDRGYFQEHEDDSTAELDEKTSANFVIDDIEQHFKKEKEYKESLQSFTEWYKYEYGNDWSKDCCQIGPFLGLVKNEYLEYCHKNEVMPNWNN